MGAKGSRTGHLVDWHLTAEPFALFLIFLSHIFLSEFRDSGLLTGTWRTGMW
jgi:hypothetical protein